MLKYMPKGPDSGGVGYKPSLSELDYLLLPQGLPAEKSK